MNLGAALTGAKAERTLRQYANAAVLVTEVPKFNTKEKREMNLIPIRKSRPTLTLLVTTCAAHCGCNWFAVNNDAAVVIAQAQEHNELTGHTCHFQGELRTNPTVQLRLRARRIVGGDV